MDAERKLRSPPAPAAAHLIAVLLVLAGVAEGQTTTDSRDAEGFAANRADAYGNVGFGLPERRPLGIFRNDAERDFYPGYQTLGRPENRRGGTIAFSLPGDLLDLTTLNALADPAVPTALAGISPARRQAFTRYGGFGPRPRAGDLIDATNIFARRYALIAATSTNAPVYRAMTQRGGLASLRSAIVRTPFVQPDVADVSESGASLFERLDAGISASHSIVRDEAWVWFGEGEYRRAARGFEAAAMLEPNDLEARVGELFCYISLRALRTSVALQEALNRRAGGVGQNQFLLDLDLTKRYGEMGTAQQLQIDAGLRAEAVDAGRNPDRTATFILVLWYLGRHNDAIRAATALSRAPEAKAYADWPAKMHAAESVLHSASGQPQEPQRAPP